MEMGMDLQKDEEEEEEEPFHSIAKGQLSNSYSCSFNFSSSSDLVRRFNSIRI